MPKLYSIKTLLLLGTFLGVLNAFIYFFSGYSYLTLILWIISIAVTASFFYFRSKNPNPFSLIKYTDLYAVLTLLIIFSPIYLMSLYTLPYQVNSDEITLMIIEKNILKQTPPDLFSLDKNYFYFPSFIYIVLGWLGNLLGGINLFNLRLVHAIFGLILVVSSYFLFRLLFKSLLLAFIGAALLAGNHSLIAISRIAIKDNTAVLVEVISFIFLVLGLKKNNLFFSFLGGAIAGLSFYTYYPSRVTFILWTLLMVFLFVFKRAFTRKRIGQLFLVSSLGFLLVFCPLLISIIKSSSDPVARSYERTNLIIYPEGRALTQQWFGGSFKQAYQTNIYNGLTVFTNHISDHGFIYPNPGHGFVDPITGILIWIGFFYVLFKKRKAAEHFLMLGGLIIIWLFYSFIVTKSPDYTRLLVILPFAIYFTVSSLDLISSKIVNFFKFGSKKISYWIILLGLMSLILISNFLILNDFFEKGLIQGNDLGSTGRYIEQRKNIPNYNFYLSASQNYPYYSWGIEYQWRDWMNFFIADNQTGNLIPPSEIDRFNFKTPFTLFLTASLWNLSRDDFSLKYPLYQITNIKTDGSLIAIEVN